jgi:hypothetical protein
MVIVVLRGDGELIHGKQRSLFLLLVGKNFGQKFVRKLELKIVGEEREHGLLKFS